MCGGGGGFLTALLLKIEVLCDVCMLVIWCEESVGMLKAVGGFGV